MLKLVSRAFSKRKKPAKKAAKAHAKAAPRPSFVQPSTASANPPAQEPDDDDLSLEDLEDMVIEAPNPPSPPASEPAPPAPPSATEPTPSASPPKPPAPNISPEREALIRNAIAIQRSKTDVFDELDEAAREKLYVMAMKTMVDKDFGEN